MDSQWQYWTLLDFVTQPVTGHSLFYSHTQVLGTYKFVESLPDLQYPQNYQQAVRCLNLLVTYALRHVPDVLTYMEHIQYESVFNFSAIPQVYYM